MVTGSGQGLRKMLTPSLTHLLPLHSWPNEGRGFHWMERGHGMSWETTELKIKVFLFRRPGYQKVQREGLEERARRWWGVLTAGTFTLEGCRSSTEIWAEAWQNQRASRDSRRTLTLVSFSANMDFSSRISLNTYYCGWSSKPEQTQQHPPWKQSDWADFW